MRRGRQLHSQPRARADGREAAQPHLPRPQRAGPPLVARVAGIERGGGAQVVPPLELHEQPRLGAGQVRAQVARPVLLQPHLRLGAETASAGTTEIKLGFGRSDNGRTR